MDTYAPYKKLFHFTTKMEQDGTRCPDCPPDALGPGKKCEGLAAAKEQCFTTAYDRMKKNLSSHAHFLYN
jgi:hypothetical protein